MSSGTALFLQNREFFGALIVHVPLLHALRKRAPGSPLVVYSPFARGRVFESLGLADETRLWTRTRRRSAGTEPGHAIGLPLLVRELRARGYRTILNLRPQSLDVSLAMLASGAAERIGYRGALARFALTSGARRDTAVYRAVNYLNLLGIEDHDSALSESMAALAARASSTPAAPARSFCLMPCGSEPPKLWGDENFLALAQVLAARDSSARFLLVLGEGERRYVELFERAGLAARTSALVGASLPEIARAVLDCRLVVANDCGPSHVAQIAGVPIVSLFGNWDGRAELRIAEWFHARAGARCLTSASRGPIQQIPVRRVLEEVERLLDDSRASGGTRAVECA